MVELPGDVLGRDALPLVEGRHGSHDAQFVFFGSRAEPPGAREADSRDGHDDLVGASGKGPRPGRGMDAECIRGRVKLHPGLHEICTNIPRQPHKGAITVARGAEILRP
ncbi:hypothetical protein MVI01_04110 [Myxococcus virescens]|uniref:Uncharacterized protein n=2 Tax=Myxococcus virescens TaxID=83456 RepID=A0A511H537_9BACT|nr:hypothetical protein MVI01_04110 [Myxococcus virescens]